MTTTTSTTRPGATPEAAIAALRSRVRGPIVTPGDPDYDSWREVMYGGFDQRPEAIVRVADSADIATVIAVARDSGLPLAVRSGGHSNAGHSTVEGGLVIDLRAMKALDIDVEARTAWAQTGLTAGEVTDALDRHDLAVGFGDTGSVGIGGITLGGGVGYLARRYGLAIDNLLAAEIVTADGRLIRTDSDHHPDLFWAIRGGGGNFGVATQLQFRLRDVSRVVGGLLVLPATAEAVAGFVDAAGAASEEVSTIANVMPAPPMPFLPESVHGQLVIFAMLACVGEAAADQAAVAPFRALAEPLVDMVRPIRYPEMFPPEDDSYHPKAVAHTMFADRVDRSTATTIIEHLQASDASMRAVQIRVLGGAVARVPSAATAYAHRASPMMINVASFYDGPEDRPVRQAWVDRLAVALDQGDPGAYVNFLGDEGPDRVRAAYPDATWRRLVGIKAAYDPDNLFRRNQNIPPVAGA